MKRFLLGTVALVALGMTAPAGAADLAARPYTKGPAIAAPIYDWSGFYIGLNGGGGSSRNCWTNTALLGVPINPNLNEGCHNATGGAAGGQFGYRWQASNWVFGLEAQGDWANFTGSNLSIPGLGLLTNRTRIDAFGLFTGQVGYAWNNALFYVKGGGAVTDTRYDGLLTGTGFVIDSAGTKTRWGGTVGAGLEYGFAPNWSVGVEYDHLFMGTQNNSFTFLGLVNTRTDSISQGVDIGTVRVNYRFGGPVVARY